MLAEKEQRDKLFVIDQAILEATVEQLWSVCFFYSSSPKVKDWYINFLSQRKDVLFAIMLFLSPDYITEIRIFKP